MKIKEVMKKNIITIPSNTLVTVAAKAMKEKNIGSIIITDNRRYIGIVTERDILYKVVAEGKNPKYILVDDIMTRSFVTIDADATLIEANEIMDKNDIRRLLVKEDNKIVGILTTREITKYLRYGLARRLLKSSEEYVRVGY